ncbi:hypothetical protein [Emticicia oligotrophica]|uniref:hypothetical protein n=1 Tax=Emticicia oligotrophica TaxID=312279 RepID=UPI00273ADB2F|nr:hypothetical protein [Emticicia oligotrophica]
MKRAIKYTAVGIVSGVILFLIIYGISQISAQKKEGKAKTLKDYLDNLNIDELKKEAIKGAFVGGGVALGIFGIKALFEYLRKNETEKTSTPFYGEKFVRNKLKEIKQSFPEFSEEELHFNLINNLCATEFENELAIPPKLHGSRAKKVSHPTSSDYDIALVFNKGKSIEERYENTFNRLKPVLEKIGYTVRDQRFSTGIIVQKDDGSTFSIDILPAKVTSNFHSNGDLIIWNSVEKTRQKTNIIGHNRQFVGNFEARDTTLLIKEIKNKTGMKLFSPIINKIVPDIIRRKGGYSKFGNLKLAIGSLARKFDNMAIQDPFNSNNNYLEKYSMKEKNQTQNLLYDILDDLNEKPKNLEKYL